MDDYISKPVSAEELEHALVRWAHPAGPAADEDDLRISIEQRLDELRGSGTPAENDLVDRLVDHFLTRAPELTSALFHALDRHDSSEIAEKAHSLKGAAGNIGAQSLADCCQDLEQAARGGAPTQLAETAPRLQAHPAADGTRTDRVPGRSGEGGPCAPSTSGCPPAVTRRPGRMWRPGRR
jgi:HPt (histidine-containing phosphotransfer) domain-containing protein